MEEIVKKLRKIEEVSHFFLSRRNPGSLEQKGLSHQNNQTFRPAPQEPRPAFESGNSPGQGAVLQGKPFAEAFCKSVDQGALGVIWLDADRIVRHVNAAAQQFLSIREEELQGKLFNFFIRIDETIRISIFRKNRRAGVGEMHMMEMEYDGEKTYLLSIKDITASLKKQDGKTLFPLTPFGTNSAVPLA